MPENLEISAVATGLEKVSFHSNPKKGNAKNGHNDWDRNDAGVTHVKPDILEYEVKWALGSITTNKASGGDEISAELFKNPNEGAIKVLH